MRYTFGDYRLDTIRREFSSRGKELHLSPKAFELLSLLVQQRPRVVSKAELMEALWPDTFVVEGNLPVIVAEVRHAFGDRAAGTAIIKTHHGIGYSFTADVVESRSGPEVDGRGAQTFLKIGDRRIALAAGEHAVGRDEDCAVYIDDASVSRKHALIKVSGVRVTIADLGSRNGTTVNSVPITGSTELGNGDELAFGKVRAQLIRSRRRNDASTVVA
ncbi:MAG TPA: FHA domain-containing protein [Vicinamibacterales bacterium]|nr:FHA domain-containing protein [Vicinamibacterales bacterium]